MPGTQGQIKKPFIIYNGPVEIQVDEDRGVVWVNSGVDGHCLIRICQIKQLPKMLAPQFWTIDVVARDINATMRNSSR